MVSSEYKHKYDSLQAVIKTNDKIMIHNNIVKDSLKAREHELNYKADSIKEAGKIQEANLKARREELRKVRLKKSVEEVAKEMTEVFKEAHPAPLFDSTVGPDITIGKNVGIHFLERDEEVEDLQMKLANTEELLSVKVSTIVNLKVQLDKAKIDSVAMQNKFVASVATTSLRDDEIKDLKKEHKKELRKQKVQKVVAVVVAGAVVVGTFVLVLLSQ